MWWGYGAGRRNPLMVAFGVALMIGFMMMMMRGVIPFFIIFFFAGPWLFRSFRHTSGWDVEPSKRKNDVYEKPKHDMQAAEPVGYLMTDDGEVMEIIDEPDRAARRDEDYF
jgi:hypothetical protein